MSPRGQIVCLNEGSLRLLFGAIPFMSAVILPMMTAKTLNDIVYLSIIPLQAMVSTTIRSYWSEALIQLWAQRMAHYNYSESSYWFAKNDLILSKGNLWKCHTPWITLFSYRQQLLVVHFFTLCLTDTHTGVRLSMRNLFALLLWNR